MLQNLISCCLEISYIGLWCCSILLTSLRYFAFQSLVEFNLFKDENFPFYLQSSSCRALHTCRLVCYKTGNVHSCQQKSIGLKFSKSQTGSDVRYSCHHNWSRFTFPIFAHSCRFSVLHSLQ